mmetsp:Transcript_7845/g.12565  ORF Transcript_7845/g.12565 Transcript_7845/m.12565 type:complete len:442 (+) Transcript_7845:39-1364(+)
MAGARPYSRLLRLCKGFVGAGVALTAACATVTVASASEKKSTIFLSVGASGAGKDTLLLKAKERLGKEECPDVMFIKRHLTREKKTTPLEKAVSTSTFLADSVNGMHALEWDAHNTKYAIPSKPVSQAIRAGKSMVMNVSRSIIDAARELFGQDAEVMCLHITASKKTLAERLRRRGRETDEQIEKRLERASNYNGSVRGNHVIEIRNEGSIEEGVDMVVGALKGDMQYALWLVPKKGETFHTEARFQIEKIAQEKSSHPFEPHVTIGNLFRASQLEAISIAKVAAEAIEAPVRISPTGMSAEAGTRFRAFVLEASPTYALRQACCTLRQITSQADAKKERRTVEREVQNTYKPHLSLLYGEYDAKTLQKLKDEYEPIIGASYMAAGFKAEELALVQCTVRSHQCWTEVARFPIKHSKPPPGTGDNSIRKKRWKGLFSLFS